jgi:hypothetical protein
MKPAYDVAILGSGLGSTILGAILARNGASVAIIDTSKTCVGDRFVLLSHSCGFIDPLFSRGICNTIESINLIAGTLLSALDPGDEAYDDFSAARLEKIGQMQTGLVSYNDRLVDCSYVSFKSYDLWNACYRAWVLMSMYGYLRVARAYNRFIETVGNSFQIPRILHHRPDAFFVVVLRDGSGRWRSEMTEGDKEIFKSIAGSEIEGWGYATNSNW